ncbi:ABC transporter ATP-binding protein [Peptostreptococcus faecalis]|uniref:ABC transporter ATP-binding protein n=1 Tax=Peptostreptococcus faecalis TaxID=2045015 RepID=UPI000C7E7622|nr:ABC transporter ATP-binding protein [Peptostreptococcus faecalis]
MIVNDLKKTYEVVENSGLFKRGNKRYIEAVKGINLQVEKGQIIGLLGLNGAGKSTTIKMLTTILSPSSGNIEIDGIDIVKNPNLAREKINMIIGGEKGLYWRLTARENLFYFGSLYKIDKKTLKNRIDKIIDVVGLADFENVIIEKYSKGMKQRMQIARGLINDPDYIFLDEPTLGLDVVIARELRNYIKKLAKDENKGVLLTTHHIIDVEEMCDYLYIIDKGEIVLEGKIDDVKEKYKTYFQYSIKVSYINSSVKKELDNLNGTKFDYYENEEGMLIDASLKENILPEVLNILIKNNIDIIDTKSTEPKLEDILISIFSKGGNIDA